MANSADPDQLASSDLDLHWLQRQDRSGFSRTRVKAMEKYFFYTHNLSVATKGYYILFLHSY